MSIEHSHERGRETTLEKVSEILRPEELVQSARIYGSSLYSKDSVVDIDMAIMIPSNYGVVEEDTYRYLFNLRRRLSSFVGADVDLIPHTFDEVEETNSPLWNPRYHPSLKFGLDVKSHFPVPEKISPIQDTSVYVLLDNRTITRRQILRRSSQENWRIFISKLIHGPGNALTHLALKNDLDYLANPSNVYEAFRIYSQVFGVNLEDVVETFKKDKRLVSQGEFSFEHALKLLNWYENLISSVLGYKETRAKIVKS
jgi:predicted nucleotidyltransferase